MKDPKSIHEPKFFLQDELIYFLQKNATFSVEMIQRSGHKVVLKTELLICDKPICGYASELNFSDLAVVYKENLKSVNDNLNEKLDDHQKHIRDLIHHMLSQQLRIESLEKALSQYDQPINPSLEKEEDPF